MAHSGRIPLHSIGHSNHPIERFLVLLSGAEIQLLVDVRSHPGSRFHPQFNKAALEAALAGAGIGYRWLGDRLGGKPKDASLLDAHGHPDYQRMAATEAFRAGIDEIEGLAADQRVAFMCAEEDPLRCHRTRLVTPALVARGHLVHHLRGDGRVIDHESLIGEPKPQQADLFLGRERER